MPDDAVAVMRRVLADPGTALAADNLRFASGFWFLIVSNDPDKTFAEAAEHVIYQVNNYSVWLEAGGLQPLAPYLNDREGSRSFVRPGRYDG
jgi:hypothetical protein